MQVVSFACRIGSVNESPSQRSLRLGLVLPQVFRSSNEQFENSPQRNLRNLLSAVKGWMARPAVCGLRAVALSLFALCHSLFAALCFRLYLCSGLSPAGFKIESVTVSKPL